MKHITYRGSKIILLPHSLDCFRFFAVVDGIMLFSTMSYDPDKCITSAKLLIDRSIMTSSLKLAVYLSKKSTL